MADKIIDKPTAIRPGEELNIARLQAYLNERLSEPGQLTVEQFPSGFSNLTYLIRLGERELVLRRPPFGANIKSAHDMEREHRVLSNLINVYPKVPRPLLYCADEGVIGAPFYVMERVQGVILRRKLPPDLVLPQETMADLSQSFIDNLAELHQVDYNAARLSDLGHPEGYVARQVHGWSKRYRNAQTDDIPAMEHLAGWLAENMPAESAATLIHNDYKYDNIVLDPSDLTRIIALLDWEMATLGDPLMDLGTTLSYWVEKGEPEALSFGPTRLPGNLSRQQLVDRYQDKTNRDIVNPVFYYAFGLFKLAVIIQQIYTRYKKGHTQDARFAGLIHVVQVCAEMASTALDKNRIYDLV